MNDVMPRDGAPRVPETVSLAPEDSELAIAAVSYYVSSGLQTLEANWGVEGYKGLVADVDSALERLNMISDFVDYGKELTTKLADHNQNPNTPMMLTDGDIEMLGFSLFRFSHDGYVRATQALDSEDVVSFGPEGNKPLREKLAQRQQQSKKIFDQLAPLAEEKNIMWMVWSSGSAARLGKSALDS